MVRDSFMFFCFIHILPGGNRREGAKRSKSLRSIDSAQCLQRWAMENFQFPSYRSMRLGDGTSFIPPEKGVGARYANEWLIRCYVYVCVCVCLWWVSRLAYGARRRDSWCATDPKPDRWIRILITIEKLKEWWPPSFPCHPLHSLWQKSTKATSGYEKS